MVKKNKKGTFRRILSLIRPHRGYVVLLILLAAVTANATLYTPILIGDGIDCIVGIGKVDFDGLYHLIMRFIIVIAVTSVSQWYMNIVTNHITYHVVKDIRIKTFSHMEELPVEYIDAHKAGDTISRITTDVEQFSDGLLMGFTQLFTGVLMIVGTLVFMVFIDVRITLLVVLITPISLFFAAFVARKTYILFRKQSETRAELSSLVDEKVGNQHIVKAFSREEAEEKTFNEINERLKITSVDAVFYSSVVNPSTRFINGLVYTGVCIYGALTAISGGITVGQLASFMNYANQYTKPFNEISGVVTELQNAVACISRIFDFWDTEGILPDKKDGKTAEGLSGSVEFRDVSFSYTPGRSFIKDLSLSARPGQRIALVGPTGCGKTTLINLLMRFYEIDDGQILLDGTKTTDFLLDSMRKNFGMVLQDTWLKSASIADNISYGKPEATREEITEAARKARADSFISRMPDKYDTIISEDGGNISEGQKQLLCIARVFLMKPPILILDEATSSIDTRTEIKVQEALDTLMKGRTSFIVAHRLSTIQGADCILVMKDGAIIESGKHMELLEKNGFYARLYQSQFMNVSNNG